MAISGLQMSLYAAVARAVLAGALVVAASAQMTSAPAHEPGQAQERPVTEAVPEQTAEDAQERAPESAEPETAPTGGTLCEWLGGTHLTGEWFGVRPPMRDVGISFEPVFGAEFQQNFRGGANTHNAHDIAGMVFWNLELDFGKMKLVPGGSLFARGLQSWHSGVQADVGSLNNPGAVITAFGNREIEIQKWWWRQRLFDDRLEFRLGKLYTGDVMECIEYSGNPTAKFLNQALYKNPTTPHTLALGAYARAWPVDWLYVAGLVADSDTDNDVHRRGTGGFDSTLHGPAHFLAYWELGFLPAELPGAKGMWPGHYRVGAWYDPRLKPIFIADPGGNRAVQLENSDVGLYVNADQMVWKENGDPADQQGLGLFARYGFAHEDANLISQYWAAGAEYLGPLPGRDEDALGFGVAQCILSGQHRRNVNPFDDRETVYELYYAIKVTPWCTVSPDIQVITNPGGRTDSRDALVAGVRITMSL